ncbi:hypothetical protein [Vannielia sp. SX4]|uniref:hypothetical protein n=1 Tax=Vannielia sp. SX4 TaxID=3463852 RepID=UPI004059B3C1
MASDKKLAANQIKTFGRGDPLYVQAQQIWLVLTGFSMMRTNPAIPERLRNELPELIHYDELAELMGKPGAQHTLNRQLGIVGHYCIDNDLPPLNVIVVNKDSELPGDGVVSRDGQDILTEISAVNKFNWFGIRVPTIGTLRKTYDKMPKR